MQGHLNKEHLLNMKTPSLSWFTKSKEAMPNVITTNAIAKKDITGREVERDARKSSNDCSSTNTYTNYSYYFFKISSAHWIFWYESIKTIFETLFL